MSKFNIGDKVRRVSPDNDHSFWNEPDDNMYHGRIYTVTFCGDGEIGFQECRRKYMPEYFELAESVESQQETYTPEELTYISELEDRIDMLEGLCSDYVKSIDEKDAEILRLNNALSDVYGDYR